MRAPHPRARAVSSRGTGTARARQPPSHSRACGARRRPRARRRRARARGRGGAQRSRRELSRARRRTRRAGRSRSGDPRAAGAGPRADQPGHGRRGTLRLRAALRSRRAPHLGRADQRGVRALPPPLPGPRLAESRRAAQRYLRLRRRGWMRARLPGGDSCFVPRAVALEGGVARPARGLPAHATRVGARRRDRRAGQLRPPAPRLCLVRRCAARLHARCGLRRVRGHALGRLVHDVPAVRRARDGDERTRARRCPRQPRVP